MATAKWAAAGTARTGLTTELNALASVTMSAVGSEIDNATNLDQYCVIEVTVTFASNPTANKPIEVHLVEAPDGTNYETSPTASARQPSTLAAVFAVGANTSLQRFVSRPISLPPSKMKALLYNGADQALSASGHTVTLYTFNTSIS